MERTNKLLVLPGMTARDHAELRHALVTAGLDPNDLVQTEAPAARADAYHEPITITILLEVRKLVIPAVSKVVAGWIVTRRASTRRREPHLRDSANQMLPVDLQSTSGSPEVVGARLHDLAT